MNISIYLIIYLQKLFLGIHDFKQEDNDKADLLRASQECPKGFDFIDLYGCVANNLYQSGSENSTNWKVVAYAPYDKAGDLKMYKYGKEVEIQSSGIIPNVSTLPDLTNFKFAQEKEPFNSFYQNLESGIQGVFIGSTATNSDFLKYDLDELNLKENFAIELRARIKKDYSYTKYYLIDSDSFKVFYQQNELKIFRPLEALITVNNSGISEEIFKNIIIKIENNYIVNVIINGKNEKVDIKLNQNLIYNRFYNIGSYGTLGQLNNIIDYLKIYKKSL